ncbi:dynein light chain Tctex-type protein 2B-like isoform 1-T1 [Anomaloglossus baeobatrachus]
MASKTSGKRASVASVRISLDNADKPGPKMPIRSKPFLGNVSISNQASWSLSGLLAAQRMTKNLKPPSFASRPTEKVQVSSIRNILESYLSLRLEDTIYDPQKVPSLVKEISEEIRSQVKKVLPARYKMLCVATMGERGQEDIKVVSRCLWDPHADNYAAHVYQNDSLFCVVSVYTVFCE